MNCNQVSWNQVEADWNQTRAKVKQKWVRLTEHDLNFIGGQRERLVSKIHERYGFATDHVRKEIEDWIRWQGAASPRRARTKLSSSQKRRRGAAKGDVTAILVAPQRV